MSCLEEVDCKSLGDLTSTRGGAYLFLPSLAALRRLAAGPPWAT